MKPKHTPGPWHLVRTEKNELELGGGIEQSTGIYSSKGFGLIANVIYKKTNILGDSKKLQKDEFEANAHIIVCSPEMLEMLERILPKLSQLQDETAFTLPEQVENLINKAKGL